MTVRECWRDQLRGSWQIPPGHGSWSSARGPQLLRVLGMNLRTQKGARDWNSQDVEQQAEGMFSEYLLLTSVWGQTEVKSLNQRKSDWGVDPHWSALLTRIVGSLCLGFSNLVGILEIICDSFYDVKISVPRESRGGVKSKPHVLCDLEWPQWLSLVPKWYIGQVIIRSPPNVQGLENRLLPFWKKRLIQHLSFLKSMVSGNCHFS